MLQPNPPIKKHNIHLFNTCKGKVAALPLFYIKTTLPSIWNIEMRQNVIKSNHCLLVFLKKKKKKYVSTLSL